MILGSTIVAIKPELRRNDVDATFIRFANPISAPFPYHRTFYRFCVRHSYRGVEFPADEIYSTVEKNSCLAEVIQGSPFVVKEGKRFWI